jgi:hypothetical protein
MEKRHKKEKSWKKEEEKRRKKGKKRGMSEKKKKKPGKRTFFHWSHNFQPRIGQMRKQKKNQTWFGIRIILNICALWIPNS